MTVYNNNCTSQDFGNRDCSPSIYLYFEPKIIILGGEEVLEKCTLVNRNPADFGHTPILVPLSQKFCKARFMLFKYRYCIWNRFRKIEYHLDPKIWIFQPLLKLPFHSVTPALIKMLNTNQLIWNYEVFFFYTFIV